MSVSPIVQGEGSESATSQRQNTRDARSSASEPSLMRPCDPDYDSDDQLYIPDISDDDWSGTDYDSTDCDSSDDCDSDDLDADTRNFQMHTPDNSDSDRDDDSGKETEQEPPVTIRAQGFKKLAYYFLLLYRNKVQQFKEYRLRRKTQCKKCGADLKFSNVKVSCTNRDCTKKHRSRVYPEFDKTEDVDMHCAIYGTKDSTSERRKGLLASQCKNFKNQSGMSIAKMVQNTEFVENTVTPIEPHNTLYRVCTTERGGSNAKEMTPQRASVIMKSAQKYGSSVSSCTKDANKAIQEFNAKELERSESSGLTPNLKAPVSKAQVRRHLKKHFRYMSTRRRRRWRMVNKPWTARYRKHLTFHERKLRNRLRNCRKKLRRWKKRPNSTRRVRDKVRFYENEIKGILRFICDVEYIVYSDAKTFCIYDNTTGTWAQTVENPTTGKQVLPKTVQCQRLNLNDTEYIKRQARRRAEKITDKCNRAKSKAKGSSGVSCIGAVAVGWKSDLHFIEGNLNAEKTNQIYEKIYWEYQCWRNGKWDDSWVPDLDATAVRFLNDGENALEIPIELDDDTQKPVYWTRIEQNNRNREHSKSGNLMNPDDDHIFPHKQEAENNQMRFSGKEVPLWLTIDNDIKFMGKLMTEYLDSGRNQYRRVGYYRFTEDQSMEQLPDGPTWGLNGKIQFPAGVGTVDGTEDGQAVPEASNKIAWNMRNARRFPCTVEIDGEQVQTWEHRSETRYNYHTKYGFPLYSADLNSAIEKAWRELQRRVLDDPDVHRNTNKSDFQSIITKHWDQLEFNPVEKSENDDTTWMGINWYCEAWTGLLDMIYEEDGYNCKW